MRTIRENSIFVLTLLLAITVAGFLLFVDAEDFRNFQKVINGELQTRVVSTTAALGAGIADVIDDRERLKAAVERIVLLPEVDGVDIAIPEGGKFHVIASSAVGNVGSIRSDERWQKSWETKEPVTVYDNYVAKGDKTGKIERIEERKVYFTYPLIQGDTPKAILSVTYLLKETDSLIDELDHGRSVRNFLFAFLVLVIVTILGALLDDRVKLSRQLLTSIESKDDLLAMASHELGSPLTNIKGSLAIILKEKGEVLEPRVRSLIERAASSAEDLINLVEDLLVVFRFERNKMEIYPRPGHIDAIVEQVVQNFQTAAHQKGITLTFDHPIGMLPRTVFDPEKIREVLNNLVSNAVKYTEKGSVTVNIEKRDDTEEVIVSVKDTGYGIKMSDVDKLFQRFVRLKRTEKVVKGTGLGLYIAKLIMEAHHGRIWAESTEGRGSVFSFSLPLR